MKNILVRADSSSFIGTGHIMRCLVLAKKYTNSNIIFACQNLDGNINERIVQNGFDVHILSSNDVDELNELIKELNTDLLIIDHYDIDYEFEKRIKDKNKDLKLFVFDDTYEKHHCDILLNHNLFADIKKYKNLVPNTCKLLCGSSYTLIRDEFYEQKNIRRDVINKIVIILGGADVNNLSFKIVKLLRKIDKIYKIKVLTTSSNKKLTILKTNKNIYNYELVVDSKNIAKELNESDLVITTTSTTLYETIFLKKLFINITVAKNQKPLENFLIEKKLNFNLSNFKSWILSNLLKKIDYNQKKIYKKLENFEFSREKIEEILAMV